MKAASRNYGPEMRGRAVRMVFEHESEHASPLPPIASIAAKRSAAMAETLRGWLRQAASDQGKRSGATTDEREREPEQGAGAEEPRTAPGERDPAQNIGVFRPGGARRLRPGCPGAGAPRSPASPRAAASFTIASAGRDPLPFGTPSVSPTPAPNRRSAGSATPTNPKGQRSSNALAETINGLDKTEGIRRRLDPIGNIPPALMLEPRASPSRRDSIQMASGKPGAVQSPDPAPVCLLAWTFTTGSPSPAARPRRRRAGSSPRRRA
ncbi:transposase-like protein [Azospirillum doebereinerae]